MKKIGLFYGTSTGKTKMVAEMIQKEMGKTNMDIFNIRDVSPDLISKYTNIIFGTSSWGVSDMQDDWEQLIDDIVSLNFKDKKIALFALGNQVEYPGSFVDAMGTLYCRFREKDNIVGFSPIKGYKYYFSSAERNGQFVGLAIDEDTQADQTPERIKQWVAQLKKEFA